MANIMAFKQGDKIIAQGDKDTAAYLIKAGWLEVHRKRVDGSEITSVLQAGEIVGELGLAGLSRERTATVVALTDGEVEVIDRGTLIRLVNKPGGALAPLLSALFMRLQNVLIDEEIDENDETFIAFAKLEGLNDHAKQALCNRPKMIGRLPWVFGAYRPPLTVTELFDDPKKIDVRLTGCSLRVNEKHIELNAVDGGGLTLRIVNYGDYCIVDDDEYTHNSNNDAVVKLALGKHVIQFGDRSDPFEFRLDVLL
ncbi:MAG: hypothetical protein COB79_00740 [Zetaproteobacteria bacterium]|nr:MAG: hypothetical protein COB79_00740 [Zetaproteobacteria bacterium]